jgi:acetamidase/formamidase
VLTIESGSTITVDTISHEGLLDDQGRDPVKFFGSLGVEKGDVLDDAIALAASNHLHASLVDGPHVITGPIAVSGAAPGDFVRITMKRLQPRAYYGIVSNRHGRGALPGELPVDRKTVSVLCTVDGNTGRIQAGDRTLRFPLNPFLGIVGVVSDRADVMNSIPPGRHGGNIDLTLLTEGASLFLPVQVRDAMVYVGDPHYSQGDGEVALTAFEAPLRATFEIAVVSAEEGADLGLPDGPYVETPELLVTTGLDVDLNAAVQNATRAALSLLTKRYRIDRSVAYAYLSAAADLHVTQVVDQVKGAHFTIRRSDFDDWLEPRPG